jgi:hypothetical protein
MNDEFGKLIIDYATKNATNLAMSIRVSQVFDDIKRKVITTFLSGLIKELQGRYKPDSWKIKSDPDPLETYAGLTIRNEKWVGHLVGIEAGSPGARNLIIGVCKSQKTKSTVPGLKAALDKNIGYGKQSDWWEWWRNLDKPYNNWDNEESLCKLFDGDAVDDFLAKSALLEIVKISDGILSR